MIVANPSGNKGTKWASEIVRYLTACGFPGVERRAESGAKDRGDIAGIDGLVIEAKNCVKMELAGWVAEARKEAVADALHTGRESLGVVWHHRKGRASSSDGYVTMLGADFVDLLVKAGYL